MSEQLIHRTPIFTVRRETWYSLVGGPTETRITIRPTRRRSWTDAALRDALAWVRAQCSTDFRSVVFSGSNTPQVMQRVAPHAFAKAKVGR